MEGGIKELANYRLERAKEMIEASKENLRISQIRTSLNRSYYAIFHAMRAANVLNGFDSSKHSGVISYFNKTYIKEEKMSKDMARIIKEASYLREKSDYDDFYIARNEEAEKQLLNAMYFVGEIEKYILGSENYEEL